jgi:hypothetical protein
LWLIDLLPDKDLETNNETTAVAMQRNAKHASKTMQLLLEMMFSTGSVPISYLEENWGDPFRRRVEAGSKTSTVALRVVGYNWAILFLGDINTGTWPSRLVEFRISERKICLESRGTWTQE